MPTDTPTAEDRPMTFAERLPELLGQIQSGISNGENFDVSKTEVLQWAAWSREQLAAKGLDAKWATAFVKRCFNAKAAVEDEHVPECAAVLELSSELLPHLRLSEAEKHVRNEAIEECAAVIASWKGRRLESSDPDSEVNKAFGRGVDMASYYIAADVRKLKTTPNASGG